MKKLGRSTILAVLALALILSGCSKSDEKAPSSSASPEVWETRVCKLLCAFLLYFSIAVKDLYRYLKLMFLLLLQGQYQIARC